MAQTTEFGKNRKRARVLLADDHRLIAEGLAKILASEYDVVGTAWDGRELVAKAGELKPDAIVMDIGMPELNGIEAARQLSHLEPPPKLIFVTQQLDVQYLRAALRAGAVAYVAKQSASTELLNAMRSALAGKAYVTPLLSDAQDKEAMAELQQTPEVFADELTPRQREVLQLVAEGKTVKEISAKLNISPKTVEFHKGALMNQTGLRTTAELTQYAILRGIVTLPESGTQRTR